MKNILFLLMILFYSCFYEVTLNASVSKDEILNIPVVFTQRPDLPQFSAVCPEYSAIFSSDKITFIIRKTNPPTDTNISPAFKAPPSESYAVNLTLLNTDSKAEIAGENPLEWKSNYFIGNNPSKWKTKVTNYLKIRIKNLYDGVDLVYYGNGKSLKYDFVLNPGENPSKINLSYSSAISLNSIGDLVVNTPFGDISEKKPYCYQIVGDKKVELECTYRIIDSSNGCYTFDIANPNPDYSVVIDPEIVFSSYFGGDYNDWAPHISKIDKDGNLYIAGQTFSLNFPISEAAYDTIYSYCGDIFLMKYNVSEKALVYSTFIGGSWEDRLSAIEIDDEENVYFCGGTSSVDFPATAEAYDRSVTKFSESMRDGFITKFNSNGDSLIFSTLLGEKGDECLHNIKINKNKEVYFTGYTSSYSFPVTADAYDNTKNSYTTDIIYGKMNSTGSLLLYSSYFGGKNDDIIVSLNLDNDENLCIAGETHSPDFPVTKGVYEENFNGKECFFVTKFDSKLNNIVFSTLINCSESDILYDSVIDKEGNIYIAGYTHSAFYPVTEGAFDTVFSGKNAEDHEYFVTKLNPSGTALIFSTFIGVLSSDINTKLSNGFMDYLAITLDDYGNIFVSGSTNNNDMPISDNALDKSFNGESDIFIMELDPTGRNVKYSTFLGGTNLDLNFGITYNHNYIYVFGITKSGDFPVTQNAFDSTYNGGWDVFFTQLYIDNFLTVDSETAKPSEILTKVYPNPFNPSTTISLTIPESGNVSVGIYNITGQKVKSLVNGPMNAGEHTVRWDASGCSAGVYFCKVKTGNFEKTMRITLLK